MRVVLFILIIGFCVPLGAQNLIPNPSFEDTVQLNFGLTFAKKWSNPTLQTTNHFHINGIPTWNIPDNAIGNQYAKTGNAYMGVLMYFLYPTQRDERREYIQAKLTRPLKFDSTYCLRMFISLADSVQFASRNQLGIYFSSTNISSSTRFKLPYTPQIVVSPTQYITDKTNWVEFNFQYQAQGGEEYITIGNFNDTSLLDTIFVGGGGTTNNLDNVSTYYYLDDLWLSHCDSLPPSNSTGINEKKLEKKIKLYPNPVSRIFNVEYMGSGALSFQLFDALGTVIPIIITARNEAVYNINVGDIPKGIYFLKVNDGAEQASFKLIKN